MTRALNVTITIVALAVLADMLVKDPLRTKVRTRVRTRVRHVVAGWRARMRYDDLPTWAREMGDVRGMDPETVWLPWPEFSWVSPSDT